MTGGIFQRVGATRLKGHSISIAGAFFSGGGGTRLKGHSISITGTQFQRGGTRLKGQFRSLGALFQRTLCNVLNVRKGKIFGSPKMGRSRFHRPCTGVPTRYPNENLTANKIRFLGAKRKWYLRTFFYWVSFGERWRLFIRPPPNQSLIRGHEMPWFFVPPTESQAPSPIFIGGGHVPPAPHLPTL